ncbi:MAG: SDR family oxidoreductase [Actinomycetota bacterium]
MPSNTPPPSLGPDTSVLVAGASGGLGGAIVDQLQRRGARMTLVGRDQAKLDALAAPGPRLAVDLRTPDACRRAVELALSEHGRLDVVINAAGVVAFGPVAELDVDVMEELFLTNTFVPIMLATAALPHLEVGAAIVNISGVIAENNLPGMAAYGASKAAVAAFDQALAREARRAGVRVIDARPPHTETGLADRPIAGAAPRMPTGLDPATVAAVIVEAIERGTTDLPSTAFAAG